MIRETHIFLVPHADDEVLSMGAGIRQAVLAGHRVYAILLTDGAADQTHLCLNGEMPCQWHQSTHDPDAEGFPEGRLSKENFIRARQQEFLKAAAMLGIPKENLAIREYPDGGLPKEVVREIAMQYEDDPAIPGPKHHHTMTHSFDNHPDHLNAGTALLELYNEGRILQPFWYVKRSQWKRWENESCIQTLPTDPTDAPLFKRIVDDIYARYQPKQNLFAIGYHSVPESFQSLLAEPYNRYHTTTHHSP